MGVLLMSKNENFIISREEKKKINQWKRNHENKCHNQFPKYYGNYFYEFKDESASIVCCDCYSQNFVKAKGNMNRYTKLMGKCGGFFAFRRPGE